MPRDLRWYWRRLRAMSPAEIAQRSYRALRHPFDTARMRSGRYARLPAELSNWRGPSQFYFPPERSGTELSTAERERAERLISGERDVLGLGWIRIPDPPWHIEPSRGAAWPLTDAGRVLAEAPADFDARLTWEFNRGHEWVLLARAWSATREQRFLARLELELESWRRNNPLGTGINWASAMEAGLRIHSLSWVSGLLRGQPLGHVARMMVEHEAFVRCNLSEHSSANNHLIVELSALAIAHRVLRTLPRTKVLARLETEISRQTFSDGVNREMATHYHMFVLEAALLVAHLERASGSPRPILEDWCRRMGAFALALRCDNGELLEHGDNDEGRILPIPHARHADTLLDLVAALDSTRSPGHRHEIFPLADVQDDAPRRAVTESRVFHASRQVVLRSARFHLTFDAGPFGMSPLYAHAHCDCLAVNLAIDGRPVIVGRGTFRYNGDEAARDRYRSTPMHNVPQRDTHEQATPGGPFLWSSVPETALEEYVLTPPLQYVRARIVDGPERLLLLTADLLGVVDTAQGSVTTRFHLSASETATQEGNLVRFPSGWLWTRQPATLVTTWHSARYGAREQATTIEIRNVGDNACVIGAGDPIDSEARALALLSRSQSRRGPSLPL